MIYDGGWFKIYFTFWLNQGLGLLYCPQLNTIGITILLWGLVIRWDDEYEDDLAEAIA